MAKKGDYFGMGRLITDIYRQIVGGIEMDIDFLED